VSCCAGSKMTIIGYLAISLPMLITLVTAGGLPEMNMNAIQLIEYLGYPAETHPVTTSDGYILGVQRIPHGIHGPSATTTPRPAVLLMHGLGGSSTNWLTNLANESLAYILAEAGFDVWLGNVRGNIYSQQHVSLSTKDPAFWHFSWQEMAEYDLPATVNYILQTTGQSQIFYAGHSQGTLIGFASFSSDLQFAKKIKTFFALAPVSTVGYITSNIRDLAPYVDEIYAAADVLGIDNTGELTWILKYLTPSCNHNDPVDQALCQNLITGLLGPTGSENLNATRIPVYLSHNPAGTSMQDVAHFGQMVNAKVMQKFDYGYFKNLAAYHSLTPPQYQVENMQTKTVLFWSANDALADQDDVGLLLPKLQNKQAIQVQGYTHFDFIWAWNAREFIYDPMVQMMKNSL